MEIVIYLLPFITSFILLAFFYKKMVWWEYLALIGSSLVFTLFLKMCFVRYNCTDVEFLGGYVTKITHYDDWDEWIHRTCTRQIPCGRDKNGNTIYRTESYDCSYREYHPERWAYTDNYGIERYLMNKREFDYMMKRLGYPKMVFRDMKRRYYRKDGDAQDYFWNKSEKTLVDLTFPRTYQNKILSSSSIFKFEDISKEDADSLGLFDYPEIRGYSQSPIMGIKPGPWTNGRARWINAIYGPKKQFRLYVLVFNDKPLWIGEKQRSYWQGGNKNEFVVCLGYDTKTHKVTWCYPFSWCDEPKLEVATRRWFNDAKKLDIGGYTIWLEKHFDLWKRKEFKDFSYINVGLTDTQSIVLLILVLILNIVLSVTLVNNEFVNECYDYVWSRGNIWKDDVAPCFECFFEKVKKKVKSLLYFFGINKK